MDSAKEPILPFKIAIHLIGERSAVLKQFFNCRSDFEARDIHGDFWNDQCAQSDRFRSTLYRYNTNKSRWLRLETIN